MPHVAWSVCLCVGQTNVLCKTAEPIEMPFRRLNHVCPRNHSLAYILDGSKSSHGNGAIRGFSGPLKSIGSLCCGVRSKRDHSMLNNGTTCGADLSSKFSLTTCCYLHLKSDTVPMHLMRANHEFAVRKTVWICFSTTCTFF